MADFVYNQAATEILDSSQDLLANTIKVGLSSSTHVPNRDDDHADEAGADDFIDGELSGTGYVAGHAGSGRLTLASKTVTVDKVNDRAEFDAADVTWTGIDAGTAAQATLLHEAGADDTTTNVIANIDSGGFPITTNGGDLTIQWNAEGIIQASTV